MGSAIMSLASFNRRFVEIIILARTRARWHGRYFSFLDLKYIYLNFSLFKLNRSSPAPKILAKSSPMKSTLVIASFIIAGIAAQECKSFSNCATCIGKGLFCGWCSPQPTVFNK